MICFPLDNTEYESNALGAWCGTRTRGVFSADGHYAATANGDMTITVGPGLAWLKADTYWGINAYEPNPQELRIETADGSLSRIDMICVRLDKNRNIGELVVKKGAYTPQPPKIVLPVRNLDYDEIYVATIMVRAGATEIRQSDITDQRLNEEYCGIMRDGITGIPTQKLYDMWMSWFDEFKGITQTYFSNYQRMTQDLYAQYSAEIAVHSNDAIAAYNAYVSRMNQYETTAKSDFETWVNTLKDILDAEVAGHLQLEIERLQERVPSFTLGSIDLSANMQLYPHCILYSTQWAFGVGGAGIGPAGGGALSTIDADYTFNEHRLSVAVPLKFSQLTNIQQITDTMYAFLSESVVEEQNLLLLIRT